MNSLSSDELVLVVDDDNKPVGSAPRSEVRAKNLGHRASYILVQNSKGELYVQKRTMLKDYCPGYFDLVSGGVMGAGETNEENAQRELSEEMGIAGVEMKLIDQIKYEDEKNKVFGNLFAVQWDGELKL